MKLDKKYLFLFIISIIALSIHFKYHKILFYEPQSMDYWRQSDCTSFALNYYQNGMHFFQPELHNLLEGNSDGRTVGEFPIIYYCVAAIYKIFGLHIFIFRFFNLLIFYFGLIALFKLTFRLTKDVFFSFVTPLLLFSSPIVLFYANNFLSDIPSLSFVFIALNCLLKYQEKAQLKDFWFFVLFFTLAVLLKANAIIVFTALGGLYFFEWIKWTEKDVPKISHHKLVNFIGFSLVVIIAICWYSWAIHYKAMNHTDFMGTQTWPGWPLWEVSSGDFVSAITKLFRNFDELFSLPLSALFFFLFPFILFNLKYLPFLLKGIFILTLLGIFLFYAFFFFGFSDNAYYYINLLIFPIITFICSVVILKQKFLMVYNSYIFRGIIMCFLLLCVYTGKAGNSDKTDPTSSPETDPTSSE
jgi:4-amino-4-deoxy-L-arabinose transferase-like glycosyltransferase